MSTLQPHRTRIDPRPDRTPVLTWNWLVLGLSLGVVMYEVMVQRGLHPSLAMGVGLTMLLGCTSGGWLRAGHRAAGGTRS